MKSCTATAFSAFAMLRMASAGLVHMPMTPALGLQVRDTDCKIPSGQEGVCILTSDCTSGGGTHTAGYCPGAADIQCCTYGSCTVSGTKGLCQPTSTCSGTHTAGYCPGPSDIQCCTAKSGGGSCIPEVNAATLNLIESFEGWSATPYDDPDGNPTIGWGHLCSEASCANIGYPIPLSKTDGAALLQSDLKVAGKCITDDISNSVKLNPNQYGALVSWAFNVGCGNAGSSTLIKDLNAGQNPDTVAAAQLPKWVYGSGPDPLPGLVRRRAAEVTLFKTAASGVAHPPQC